jgi:hypothetical protein
MNASKRWAYHFVTNLECVRCRGRTHRKLYHFLGYEISSDKYTLDELQNLVPHMDVWCENCSPRVNSRVTGPGRLAHKQEAARIASVAAQGDWRSAYDSFVLDNGRSITKKDLIVKVKDRPCAVCGILYPPEIMEFYHITGKKKTSVSRMVTATYSVQDVIEEIEKCALLCANCLKLVSYKYTSPPTDSITLDENFFSTYL